jgi:hypothetical protein
VQKEQRDMSQMSLAEYVEMLDKAGLLVRYSDEKRVAELIEQALHGA